MTKQIPKGWQQVRISEISDTYAGGTPSRRNKKYYKGKLLWVKSGELNNGLIFDTEEKITNEALNNSSAKIVPKNTVLIAMYGATAGKVGVLKKEGTTNQAVLAVPDSNNKFHYKYIYYLLSKETHRLLAASQGTGQPNLSKTLVDNLKVLLPPKKEQQKIAEILSSADEAIQKVDKAIKKTERLKQGLMNKLLTEGIGHKEFKKTKIGKIPKEWDYKRLGEIVELCQYGISQEMYNKGKYPIIRMDEFNNGYVKSKISKYVNISKEMFRKYEMKYGDILFNRTNSFDLVGRTGIFKLTGDYVFASYLIRIRPKMNMADSDFLTYYLIHSHGKLKALATKAVHQANINATNLKNYLVLLPPIKEQEKIAKIVNTLDVKLELQQKRKEKLIRIKQGLMNDLLTGRKRVKV